MNLESDRQRFIEETGDLIEDHGMTRMTGRVIGALLVCVPAEMSMDDLAEQLQASKGSISTATRLLLQLNLVEKVRHPGDRKHYYRIRDNAWAGVIADRARLDRHLEVVEKGLRVMKDESVEMRGRILEMKLFFEFMKEEMPELLQRWEQERRNALGS